MNTVVIICLILPVILVVLYGIIRSYRSRTAVPIPAFLTTLIDHPLRHRFVQPPEKTPARHGIREGMRVLEVGPGRGTYTLAAARAVGESGEVVAIDIDPGLVERLQKRSRDEGITNLEVHIGDACNLEFGEEMFDVVYMITVMGELPDQSAALSEFHRVLREGGILAISELLPDPDYVSSDELMRLVTSNGFRVREEEGNRFYYTLLSEKL